MFKYLFVLALTAPLALGLDNFEPCKNNGIGILPDWAEIKDCPTAPCHFTEGEWIEAQAGFKVPYASQNLTVALAAYKFGIRIDFDFPPDVEKACDWIEGGSCPLKGGEEIVYTLSAQADGIPKEAHGMLVQIEFSLRNDLGKNMACIRFPAYGYNP